MPHNYKLGAIKKLNQKNKIMKFVNKNTGDIITSEVYFKLSSMARQNYIEIKGEEPKTTIIKNESDSLSVGDGIAAAVAIPFIVLDSIFGGD